MKQKKQLRELSEDDLEQVHGGLDPYCKAKDAEGKCVETPTLETPNGLIDPGGHSPAF